MSGLFWTETFDDDNNSIWEAPGPFTDCNPRWRLVQKLANNRIEWHAEHTAELGDTANGEFWLSLEEAKAAVESTHSQICVTAWE